MWYLILFVAVQGGKAIAPQEVGPYQNQKECLEAAAYFTKPEADFGVLHTVCRRA